MGYVMKISLKYITFKSETKMKTLKLQFIRKLIQVNQGISYVNSALTF